MGDGRVIALQRHVHMRDRRVDQHIFQYLGHHNRGVGGIGQIACLHAGEHQHMDIMADERAIERGAVQVRHEPLVGRHGKAAAARRLVKVTDQSVNVRRHMLQVAGIGRRQFLQPAGRRQRLFRRRRHLLHMDIEMQHADMVGAGTGERTFESCLDFPLACFGVRRALVHVIDLPRRQHDLRIDIERGDIRVVPVRLIDRDHGIGVGALPRCQDAVVGNFGLRIAHGKRLDQGARLRRGVGRT